jgi:hypothetical protein
MMADSAEKRAKKAELQKALDRALAADVDRQAMERRVRIRELQEQAAEAQRQHEALQRKRLKIQAHKDRGIEYLASLEIRNLGGASLRLVDLEDPPADELEAGHRTLQEQARREGKSRHWAEDVKKLSTEQLRENYAKDERRVEKLRKSWIDTKSYYAGLEKDRREREQRERYGRLERRAQRYVVPWGLEEIIKPMVGYILLRTFQLIDKKARGEVIETTKPPTDYYVGVEMAAAGLSGRGGDKHKPQRS